VFGVNRVKKPPQCESLLKVQCFPTFSVRRKGRRSQAVGASLRAKAVLDLSPAGAAAKSIVSLGTRLATETKMSRLVPTRVHVLAAALGLVVSLAWAVAPNVAKAQGAAQPSEATQPNGTVQPQPPAPDDGRYAFHRRGEGFVRLDSRTGQVSQCGWSPNTWSCKVVPDERAALESEINRLQRDNAALKNSLLAGGLELPNGIVAEAPAAPGPVPPGSVPDLSAKEPKGPTEVDLDRAFTFMKNVWRRLVDMMVDLQRDMQRKS
jgi:hypothetical protein